MTLKLLLNLRAKFIAKMSSLILTFPTHTERQAEKAPTCYRTVAEVAEWHENFSNLPNGKKVADLPNGAKTLGRGVLPPLHPAKSFYGSIHC